MSATSPIVSEHRLASSVDLRLPQTRSIGVELGSVTGEWLYGEPLSLTRYPRGHTPTAVSGQSVPDEQQWTLLNLVQLAQELNECFVVIGARSQLEDEMRVTTIRCVRQRAGQRQPFPVEAMAQHRCVASGCPGRSY